MRTIDKRSGLGVVSSTLEPKLSQSIFYKNDKRPLKWKTPDFPQWKSPLGNKSIFNDPCDGNCEYAYKPFTNTETQGINIRLLAEDLNGENQSVVPDQSLGGPLTRNRFVYTRYITDKQVLLRPDPSKIEYADISPVVIGANEEIQYVDEDGNNRITFTAASLNEVQCCINTVPRFGAVVSPERCIFTLCYLYKLNEQLEEGVNELMDKLNVTGYLEYNPDYFKYIAINLRFPNADDLIAFLKKANQNRLADEYGRRIISRYEEILFRYQNESSQINSIYENMPVFVAVAIGSRLGGEDMLFDHLIKLLDYDDKGMFSGLRDSSNAVVNLLKGFTDYSRLYERLYSSPELVKRIYDAMQGESVLQNIEISNRTAFCSFITVLCNACLDPGKITGSAFYVGKGYELDSNLDSGYDDDPGKILLIQKSVPQPSDLSILSKPLTGDISNEYYSQLPQNKVLRPALQLKQDKPKIYTSILPEIVWFHPLDMVRLIYADNGRSILVPAIFVKDISDLCEQQKINSEWAKLLRDIQVGIDLFVAAFTLVAALSNPGVAILRSITFWIGVGAAADAAIVSYEEEINNTRYGPVFLKAWHQLQLLAGTKAFFELSGYVLATGAKLLIGLKVALSRDYVMNVLFRIIMEINIVNFTGNTVKLLNFEEVRKFIKVIGFGEFQATRLLDAGVLFLTTTTKMTKEEKLFVIYRQQIIASGTASKVREFMKDVFKIASPNKLVSALDKMLEMAPKLNGNYWTAYNKAGSQLRWKS
ncbi:MAG: hypothetical protein NTW29_15450 [Bacteroidetes bacterium]|nr:hypothetical protein [Bacteroidota bacterium]